ncbi:LysE family translocator [Paracraurococcus ruber]|uniref:LysE family translocator n=1 Tax=Paracraurococcus ruber TaxID=77675 RepID=UPI0019073307|nr:LysE family translocator [Paracraurococcus ruber]
MPDLTQFVLYVAAAAIHATTPGPGIFYVAARTLAGDRAEGVASSLGTGLGGMIHVLAGALGVSALVLASAELFTVLKLFGAAYLVWLGLRTIQAARRGAMSGLADASSRSYRNSSTRRTATPPCNSWCWVPSPSR